MNSLTIAGATLKVDRGECDKEAHDLLSFPQVMFNLSQLSSSLVCRDQASLSLPEPHAGVQS